MGRDVRQGSVEGCEEDLAALVEVALSRAGRLLARPVRARQDQAVARSVSAIHRGRDAFRAAAFDPAAELVPSAGLSAALLDIADRGYARFSAAGIRAGSFRIRALADVVAAARGVCTFVRCSRSGALPAATQRRVRTLAARSDTLSAGSVAEVLEAAVPDVARPPLRTVRDAQALRDEMVSALWEGVRAAGARSAAIAPALGALADVHVEAVLTWVLDGMLPAEAVAQACADARAAGSALGEMLTRDGLAGRQQIGRAVG